MKKLLLVVATVIFFISLFLATKTFISSSIPKINNKFPMCNGNLLNYDNSNSRDDRNVYSYFQYKSVVNSWRQTTKYGGGGYGCPAYVFYRPFDIVAVGIVTSIGMAVFALVKYKRK